MQMCLEGALLPVLSVLCSSPNVSATCHGGTQAYLLCGGGGPRNYEPPSVPGGQPLKG